MPELAPVDRLVAIHFGLTGRLNGWTPAYQGLFILPVVGVPPWVLRRLAPGLAPRGANLERSPAAYGTIWIAMTLLLGWARPRSSARRWWRG